MKASGPSRPRLKLVRLGMALLAALLLTGCETARDYSLTYKLWDKGTSPSCQPAPEAKLAVFTSQIHPDVLVIYDALDERADEISRRAYFLQANETRIAARQKPLYVSPSLATNLSAVPVVATTNAVTRTGVIARYPVSTDNGWGFELYRAGRSEGTHALPVYGQGVGPVPRVALTPFAVVGDTVMVGAGAAVVGAFLWVQAGCPPFSNR